MRLNTLEALVPGLRAARFSERLNRALAFSGITWTVCGVEILHLTPRHRLELQLSGNAFEFNLRPMEGDVFNFLWRLSPEYRRSGFGFAGMMKKARLRLLVKRMRKSPALLRLAESQVLKYLVAMRQDLPEEMGGGVSSNPPEAYIHWMATESFFYMQHLKISLEDYMDTPYLVLQQWFRCFRLANEEDVNFINASDRLVSEWQRSMKPSREKDAPKSA